MSTRRDVDVFLRFMKDEFLRIARPVTSTRLPTEISITTVTALTSRSSVDSTIKKAPVKVGRKQVMKKQSLFLRVLARILPKAAPGESSREVASRSVRFSCIG